MNQACLRQSFGRRRASVWSSQAAALFIAQGVDGIEPGGLGGRVDPEEDADHGREAEGEDHGPDGDVGRREAGDEAGRQGSRAVAQVARRQEYAAICDEKFECPPPLLPEELAFDEINIVDPEIERENLDRLTAERERIGPVNLVAEQELAELDTSREMNVAEKEELAQARRMADARPSGRTAPRRNRRPRHGDGGGAGGAGFRA